MKWVSWMCRSTAGPPVEALVLLDPPQVHLLAGRPEVAADAAPVAGELLRVAAAQGGHAGALELARGEVVDHAHKADAHDPNLRHFCNLPCAKILELRR